MMSCLRSFRGKRATEAPVFTTVAECIKYWSIKPIHVLLYAIGTSGERTFTEEDAEDILKTCFPDYTPNLVRDHPDVVQVTQIDKNRHWILLRDEIVGTECHGEAHIIGKDGALIVHSPFWQASKVTFKRKRGPEVSCEILKAE